MTNDIIQSDLDWLAFCYAAGELDLVQAEAFEARLADDQAAREALARAVELTQTVAAAERGLAVGREANHGEPAIAVATRTRSDWNRRLSWMAVGGLASVLVALLWSGFVGPTWNTAQHRFTANSRYQLAMAWSETRNEFADVREAALWQPLGSESSDDASWAFMSEDEVVGDAPSWMTAAVFTAPRESNEENPSPEQPENE